MSNAQIHRLLFALEQALAILQIVQHLHHLIVDFVDLTGHIVAGAGLVEQKRNVIARPNDERHLDGGGGFAPKLGQAIGRIGEHRMAGLAGLQRAVDEETLQRCIRLLRVGEKNHEQLLKSVFMLMYWTQNWFCRSQKTRVMLICEKANNNNAKMYKSNIVIN